MIALLLLLGALLTLSGLPAAAAALVHAETAQACCDRERDDGETGADPCSLPDCPCLSCLTIDLVNPPEVRHRAPAGAVSRYAPPHRFHVSEYISSIDYPPETL